MRAYRLCITRREGSRRPDRGLGSLHTELPKGQTLTRGVSSRWIKL